MRSDDHIIRQVLGGSKVAYAELLERHQKSAYRLAFRVLGRREEAEDAVQDAFVKAYMSLESYKQKGMFWPWFRRIVLNTCFSMVARKSHSEVFDDFAETEASLYSLEEEVLSRATARDVQEAIQSLAFNYRTVVVLKFQEQLSYKEIAEITGESVENLKVRMYRAKKMLADRLGGKVYEML